MVYNLAWTTSIAFTEEPSVYIAEHIYDEHIYASRPLGWSRDRALSIARRHEISFACNTRRAASSYRRSSRRDMDTKAHSRIAMRDRNLIQPYVKTIKYTSIAEK